MRSRGSLVLLLVALVALDGCLALYDFEDYGGSAAGGSAGGAAAGGAAAGGAVVGGAPLGGGENTGGGCGGADLSSSEANCGSCGFSCGSAECVDGVCGLTSIDLASHGGDLTRLLVSDAFVYVTQRDGAGFSGHMRSLPIDFDANSAPGNGAELVNVIGPPLAGGHKRVYQSGQDSSPPRISACDEDGCEAVLFGGALTSHPNAMVAVDSTLYVLVANGDNRLRSFAIGADGVPSNVPVSIVDSYADGELSAEGAFAMQYAASPPRLYWSSYGPGGCLFKGVIGAIDLEASCWSESFVASDFRIAADGSSLFAQDGSNVIRLTGDPPTLAPFVAAAGLRDAAEGLVYITNDSYPEKIQVVTETGAIAASPPACSAPVASVDARHPDYVFYVAGSTLYRWPKPRCGVPTCGDGCVDGLAEQCDDGNNASGDGCSMVCSKE